MKSNYFRGFTGILYLPKEKIAHFIDYPKFDESSIVNKDDLLARLNESRAQVSFTHLKEEVVKWQDIRKHPYFIAWAGGEEGAEKLAEFALGHSRREDYILVPDVSDLKEPIARVATLYSDWVVSGLSVDSDYLGDEDSGYAFAVSTLEQSVK